MNKDVIYIDVDDDVTAIIGKIKTAKEKIVALVPPKRAGALQSAVNLRLLERMAKAEKKQLVLITANQALVGLAANAKIPVAKNLQTKPELAQIPAIIVDDGDDIIDGAELPVGDLARTVKAKDGAKPIAGGMRSDAIDNTDLSIDGEAVPASVAATAGAATARAAKKRKGTKIPNFDTFRKKLFLIIGGAVALVALLIWMFVFAPAATVIITASTTPTPVNASVKLGGTAATDYPSGVISSLTQQDKKDVTTPITPTGQKDVGNPATGTMKLTRTSVSSTPITVPSGTQFTAGGLTFVSTQAATLAGTTIGPSGIVQDSATVSVTASAPGTQYNVPAQSYQSSSGGYSSYGSAMAGGTSNVVTVVTQDDIDRATAQLQGMSNDDEKKALAAKFTNGEIVVDGSFTADAAAPVASPAVNQPAPDGKATLTASTTYSLQAVTKDNLDSYLNAYLTAKMSNGSNQKIYSTGIDKATLSNYQKNGDTAVATINATGSVGPKIDETAIKNQVKGKIYGEVQQSLQSMDGVKSVDVQFSYFWVRRVPNDTNKITIQFKVDNSSSSNG
ncbi:MAG TPA: hypothetical protein VN081_01065 [Dongiaceae bacterium]|nr:hypothetical protein [Dongiaceae bacterium]